MARRTLPDFAPDVRIERAALGGDVSLIGLLPIVNDRIGDAAPNRVAAVASTDQPKGASLP
jgi:hypothetical protein